MRHAFFFLLLLTPLILGAEPYQASDFETEPSNYIIVCDNGLEMFAWDLDFISQAEESVEIAACFFGGTILHELFDVLEARWQERPELQVFILTTPTLLTGDDRQRLASLEKKYSDTLHIEHATNIPIVWPDISGIDNHIKMCVVDETYFSSGGTNLDESQCSVGTFTPVKRDRGGAILTHLPAGMRDQDFVGRGAMAKTLRKIFHRHFALWKQFNQTQLLKKEPADFEEGNTYFEVSAIPFVDRFETSEELIPIQENQVEIIVGGPHQKENAITRRYVELIDGAQEKIIIENLYFSPVDAVMEALLRAVNRGIELIVVTNGIYDQAPDTAGFFAWANRITYTPMFYGRTFSLFNSYKAKTMAVKNTRIYEYEVPDITLHKKTMIVDGKIWVVGSYNLGIKSHTSDYELIAVFHSEGAARTMYQVFQRDLEHCKEISPAQARSWYFNPFIAYWAQIQKRFHGLI